MLSYNGADTWRRHSFIATFVRFKQFYYRTLSWLHNGRILFTYYTCRGADTRPSPCKQTPLHRSVHWTTSTRTNVTWTRTSRHRPDRHAAAGRAPAPATTPTVSTASLRPRPIRQVLWRAEARHGRDGYPANLLFSVLGTGPIIVVVNRP